MKPSLTINKILLILILVFSFSSLTFAQEELDTQDLLEMDLEALLNMDVTTASKTAEKQSDAPGILSVLSKDDLERFGGTTLADILVRVPGLNFASNYMTDRSVISSRGDQIPTTSNHVLLLINGRPVREMLEAGISSEMYETFPVNIIERIEVIRGPGSVLYGSNAFSGVINVITESAEGTNASVSGLVGQGGAAGFNGDVKIKAGDFSFVAAGRYLKKAEWETTLSGSGAAFGIDGIITKDVDVPNEGTGVFVDAGYKGLRFMGGYNEWETFYGITDYIAIFESHGTSKWKKMYGNLGYDTEFSENWNTSFNVSYTKSELEVSSWPGSQRSSNEIVAEWTNFVTLSEKSKFIFGGLFTTMKGTEDSGPDRITDASASGYGLYTQIDYSFLKNLKAIGGIQLIKIENVDLGFVPRAGIIWSPAEKINVKALYSQAFRAPSLNETSIDFDQLQGTSDLNPEKVGTFDVSISYLGDQGQASINFFQSKMTDVIFQDRSSGVPTYNNYGDATTITGFEFEGKYYLNKNLYLTGSTLYQNAKDDNDNEDITPIAEFGFKAGISYVFDKGVTISLFDVYQGDLSDTFKSDLNVSAGSYNLLQLYGNVDLNKVINLKLKQKFSLFVQVDNLLDKEVWLPAWGLSPGQTLPFIQGRSVYVGLKLGV